MYIDMAWTPSHVRQQSAMVRYWRRLCRMPRNRIATTIFEWDHDLAAQGNHTWSWCRRRTWRYCGRYVSTLCGLYYGVYPSPVGSVPRQYQGRNRSPWSHSHDPGASHSKDRGLPEARADTIFGRLLFTL